MRFTGLDDITIVHVSAGGFHTMALATTGEIFAWGRGCDGQTGLGHTKDTSAPSLVRLPQHGSASTACIGVECGWSHTLCVTNDAGPVQQPVVPHIPIPSVEVSLGVSGNGDSPSFTSPLRASPGTGAGLMPSSSSPPMRDHYSPATDTDITSRLDGPVIPHALSSNYGASAHPGPEPISTILNAADFNGCAQQLQDVSSLRRHLSFTPQVDKIAAVVRTEASRTDAYQTAVTELTHQFRTSTADSCFTDWNRIEEEAQRHRQRGDWSAYDHLAVRKENVRQTCLQRSREALDILDRLAFLHTRRIEEIKAAVPLLESALNTQAGIEILPAPQQSRVAFNQTLTAQYLTWQTRTAATLGPHIARTNRALGQLQSALLAEAAAIQQEAKSISHGALLAGEVAVSSDILLGGYKTKTQFHEDLADVHTHQHKYRGLVFALQEHARPNISHHNTNAVPAGVRASNANISVRTSALDYNDDVGPVPNGSASSHRSHRQDTTLFRPEGLESLRIQDGPRT